VLAVEPAAVARRLARQRIAASSVPIEHIGLDGQSIPLDDGSCDCALATFTLCTVPTPSSPGGTAPSPEAGRSFHFSSTGSLR